MARDLRTRAIQTRGHTLYIFIRLWLLTCLLSLNACLTLMTYDAQQRSHPVSRARLGPPETYDIVLDDSGQIKTSSVIGLQAKTWWGYIPVHVKFNASLGEESHYELSEKFLGTEYMQSRPYIVSSSGFVGDISALHFDCPAWANALSTTELVFHVTDDSFRFQDPIAVNIIQNFSFAIVRVQYASSTKYFKRLCDAQTGYRVNRMFEMPEQEVPEGSLVWQTIPTKFVAPKNRLLTLIEHGPLYVSIPNARAMIPGRELIIVPDVIRRDCRFFDKKCILYLAYPFAVSVDIMTFPLQAPFIYRSWVAGQRNRLDLFRIRHPE